jgi:hypothetical protein
MSPLMLGNRLLLLFWLFCVYANSLPSALQIDQTPETDVFYHPPILFEDAKLGTILKYRRAPQGLRLSNILPYKIKAAWQVLYRTQNSVGKPEATVVTILVPLAAKKKNLFSLSYFTVSKIKYNFNL